MRTSRDVKSCHRWIAVVTLFILATLDLYGQFQRFTLLNREYRLVANKWHASFAGMPGDEIIPLRIIVRLANKGYLENFDFYAADITGVSVGSPRFLGGYYVLTVSPDHDPFQVASLLEKTGKFDVLAFDSYGEWHVTPSDPEYSKQWNLPKIQMPSAWDITTGSNVIILGIIDSGTRYTHEDLDGNIWVNQSEDRNGNGRPDFYPYASGGDLDGTDNDGNGFVDDLVGWDFYQTDNTPDDAFGHGTNVAGVSSAQTNNYENGAYRGVAGIAGGWGGQRGASVMILRTGNTAPIASLTNQAIEYAALNGARVINISSGFFPEPSGMADAVNLAVSNDVVIVASAGNNGDLQDPSIRYPARFTNTLAVGATDQNDNRRSYSAYGQQLDVVAPDGVPTTTMAGGYTSSVSGTSFSAPHVAGLAALIRTVNPGLSWQQVRDVIRGSADKVSGMGGQNFTDYYGIDPFFRAAS